MRSPLGCVWTRVRLRQESDGTLKRNFLTWNYSTGMSISSWSPDQSLLGRIKPSATVTWLIRLRKCVKNPWNRTSFSSTVNNIFIHVALLLWTPRITAHFPLFNWVFASLTYLFCQFNWTFTYLRMHFLKFFFCLMRISTLNNNFTWIDLMFFQNVFHNWNKRVGVKLTGLKHLATLWYNRPLMLEAISCHYGSCFNSIQQRLCYECCFLVCVMSLWQLNLALNIS